MATKILQTLTIKDGIRWHRNCYSSFTSKTNLKQCSQDSSSSNKRDINCTPSSSCTRSKIDVNMDFKKVCFLCEKTNHQGCRNLLRVEIPSFWETLEKRWNERNDSYLRMNIGGGFTKLARVRGKVSQNMPCFVYKTIYLH